MLKGKKLIPRTKYERDLRYLYDHTYKHNCTRMHRSFNLTLEEFHILTKDNCAYCGRPPSNKRRSYIYNGVDRLDNNKDYDKSNCVTCCKECNWLKGQNNFTFKEMRAIAQGLLNYRRNLGGPTQQWVPELMQSATPRPLKKTR